MKNRIELAKFFATKGFKVGAEVGVLKGVYSEILSIHIPDLKLYCIDSWTEGSEYGGNYEQAKKRLAPYDCTLIRKTSMEAVKDFEDKSLDFVYLDADHLFDGVMKDILFWSKKVKKRGIIAGHDYEHRSKVGVITAVDAFVKEHQLKLNVTEDPKEGITWWVDKRWNT